MKPSACFPEPAPPPRIVETIETEHSDLTLSENSREDLHPWQAYHYKNSGYLALAVGQPFFLTRDTKNTDALETAAVRILLNHASELGIEGCDIRWESVTRHRNRTVMLAGTELDDVRVFGSYIVLSVNPDGSLATLKSRGFGCKRSGEFIIPEERAVAIATEIFHRKLNSYNTENIWLPVPESNGAFRLKPCIMIEMEFDDPELRPVLFIDASNGEVLAYENRVVYDDLSGNITGFFAPLYARDEQVENAFSDEYIRVHNVAVEYTGEMGDFLFDVHPDFAPYRISSELRGRWVNVDWDDGDDARYELNMEQPGIVNLVWTDERARLDERGLYYHTNFIHDFWKELDRDFDGLDYDMPAVCGVGNNFDNAFWNGIGMYFGEGGEMDNFALYSDIIYHEYGHGVTHHIYPRDLLPYRDEPGALNEAWSDYFPCSITDEPLMGEGGLIRGNGYIRNLDNDYVYPEDIRGEVHLDSRLISAAMWHSRELLGREITDPLFHFSRYELGNQFILYFTDVLITDDNDGDITNGTPNYEVLYEQFGRHGIGPGVIPKLSFTRLELFDDNLRGATGNDNGQWEAGETVRIEVQLERKGFLYPPPAEDVRVAIQTDHPYLTISQDVAEFGDMRVEDRQDGDQALLFDIDPDAELSFAYLYFTISTDNGEYQFQDTLRIPIGRPPVLLVKDGFNTIDRSEYFRTSLDDLGVVYDYFSIAEPVRTLQQRLSLFETVIWFTGDAKANILDDESIIYLEDFLNAGGNLLLTGQSAFDTENAAEFMYDYLGTECIADSIYDFEINGVEGDPVSQGKTLLILGWPGAMNQKRPSVIEAVEPAVDIYHWRRNDGEYSAGIRRIDPETGSRTITLSFGLEAVSGRGNTNTRAEALGAALDWLGVANSAPLLTEPAPVLYSIGSPYPNPFNDKVRIPLFLSQPDRVDLQVYDLGGRLIKNRTRYLQAGSIDLPLDAGDLSTGLYILRIEAGSHVTNQRLVLIR